MDEQEDLAGRNATSRVFVRTYEVDQLDPEGNPTGETYTVERTIVHKGDGLCYDVQNYAANPQAAPQWLPSNTAFAESAPEGFRFSVEQANPKLWIAETLSSPYYLTAEFKNRELVLVEEAGIESLGYFDPEKEQYYPLEYPKAVAAQASGDSVLFPGAFSVGDLRLRHTHAGFKQELVINTLEGLPSPESFGLASDAALLCVRSRVKITTPVVSICTLDAQGEALPLEEAVMVKNRRVELRNEKRLLSYFTDWGEAAAEGKAAAGDTASVSRWVSTQGSELHIIEGVPYQWLTSSERAFPLLLDYEQRGDNMQGSETWRRGVTYFVQNTITVPTGRELTIEPGAVVKVNGQKKIIIDSDAHLKARGKPYDYVIFTNASDNRVGEEITNGVISGVAHTHLIIKDCAPESFISYCKFDNASDNVAIEHTGEDVDELSVAIENCVFHNGAHNIHYHLPAGHPSGSAAIKVFNCLFAHFSTYGVVLEGYSVSSPLNISVKVYNCTFDGGGLTDAGMAFWYDPADPVNFALQVHNNLFTDIAFGLFDEPGGGNFSGQVWYSRHTCPEESFLFGDFSGVSEVQNLPIGMPYESSENGEYYNQWWNTQLTLLDKGELFTSYSPVGWKEQIKSKTLKRPLKITRDNVNDTSTGDGKKFHDNFANNITTAQSYVDSFFDGGTRVDIGYHYDPVHVMFYSSASGNVIYPSHTKYGNLFFPAGCVLCYHDFCALHIGSALYPDDENIVVEAVGSAYDDTLGRSRPVLFTSRRATSDKIELPEPANKYTRAIQLYCNTSPNADSSNSKFACCKFEHGDIGISLFGIALRSPIANSCFSDCNYAIDVYNPHEDNRMQIDIMNNLIAHNQYGIKLVGSSASEYWSNVEGNTFYGNTCGLYCKNNHEDLRLVLEDNLFVGNDTGVYVPISDTSVTCINRNNLLWNNLTNLDDYEGNFHGSGELASNDDNPLFVHRSRSASSQWIHQYEVSPWGGWPDGFFLAQYTGDASRLPFEFHQDQMITGVDFPDENDPFANAGDVWMFIGAAVHGYPPADYMESRGIYYGQWESFEQDSPGAAWLWIENTLQSPFIIPSHTYFSITFDNESTTLDVYLPQTTVAANSSLILWIAEDGSAYWARQDQGCGSANMEAYYGIRWKETNLAACAYEERDWRTNDLPGSDSRKLPFAHSPAVDAGSRDFLNLGYTSTNIDPNLANSLGNTLDLNRDNPGNPATRESEYINTLIDLGWHYYGALSHPCEKVPLKTLTVRNPLTWVYYQRDFEPYIWKNTHFAIASGKPALYASEKSTVVVYSSNYHIIARPAPYEYIEDIVQCLLFHDFRTGTTGKLAEFWIFDKDPGAWENVIIDSVAMTTAIDDAQGEGTIYAACSVGKTFDLEEIFPAIHVFRYQGNGLWTYIARTDYETVPWQYKLNGVALAAYGNTLWVFYTREDWDMNTITLRGKRIPSAATRTSAFEWDYWIADEYPTDDTYRDQWLEPFPSCNIPGLLGHYLFKADFDPIISAGIFTGLPRLAWWWYVSGTTESVVRSARVALDPAVQRYREPLQLTADHDLTAGQSAGVYDNPALAVNYYDRSKYTYDAPEAFAGFQLGSGQVLQTNVNVVSNVDQWALPAWGISGPAEPESPRYPDVTYRAFGQPRYCFRNGLGGPYSVITNSEIVSPGLNGSVYPKICTSAINQTDVFLAHTSRTADPGVVVDDIIYVFHIDP